MSRVLRISAVLACVSAIALVGSVTASAGSKGGMKCGQVTVTDKAGNTAKLRIKSYSTGCERAFKGSKRFYRQVNGEQGVKKTIKGFTCGPLQPFKMNGLAFQCRSNHLSHKRYKAKWVKLTKEKPSKS